MRAVSARRSRGWSLVEARIEKSTMKDEAIYAFRDPALLVRWTKVSIYAQLLTSCIALISGYLEYEVLAGLQNGAFESQQAAISAAEASDARQGVVGIAQFVTFIVSGILILRWIHRVNWNARALGAQNLQFTPGWAIGWYFVPVMNLWKPYQAMKEIWRASVDPANWHAAAAPALIGFWWFFWIVSSVLGNVSFRLMMRAESIDQLIYANIATFASDLSDLPLCIVFLLLLNRIDAMQSRQWDSNGELQ